MFCVDRKAQKKSVESLVYSSQPVTVSFKENSNYSWFAFTTKIDVVLLIFENTFGRLRKTARLLATKQLRGKQISSWSRGRTWSTINYEFSGTDWLLSPPLASAIYFAVALEHLMVWNLIGEISIDIFGLFRYLGGFFFISLFRLVSQWNWLASIP